jgi:hypothetical protein
MCRKAHGAAFATYVRSPSAGFQLLQGADRIGRYESSPGFFRAFCSQCGSVVPSEPGGERMFTPAGNLDDDPGVKPVGHIYVGSKAPWYEITDDATQFELLPPGMPDPGVEARPLPERLHPGAVRGSCLCGGVVFEVTGELPLIIHCHCSRCRKARSAPHNANAFARPDQIHFHRGQDLLRTYKLPTAKQFAPCFCGTCGSPMPRMNGQGEHVGIPAGAFDDDPGARPRLHIFTGSKASWYDIPGDLPQFDEYPPGRD